MELVIELPDELLNELGGTVSASRQMLEAFAAEKYRSKQLSRAQVARLLGLDYWETDRFLSNHDARRPYTLADLEIDRKSLAKLQDRT